MRNISSLDTLKKGKKAIIVDFNSNEIPAKFYEMGFIPGTEIEVKHIAPLNGPICLNIIASSSLVAIRRSEAKVIIIDSK
ncbi:ferrous iron transport protein A [Sphingobacterium sp. SRCM116780]|uniref:FeoA family protein n=1 Tax=Sphingobacterium sp. SRCM116780 TaxID=2907623 RepID=UPI001F37D7D0|nr:FeoA family protein [Sphingobacterium sp. SRCM116780]UIR54529.1 ferrous iron transport protein A [Sphingobacterium sp. SRCM116780]